MTKHSEISGLYFKAYVEGEIEDHEMVQFIDQAMSYLGAKTLAAQAKYKGVDYNIIKKQKKRQFNPLFTFVVGGVEFVANND